MVNTARERRCCGKIFLFHDADDGLSLLDHLIRLVVDESDHWRAFVDPFAAVMDPRDKRLELFFRFAFYEGGDVRGYDVTDGHLRARSTVPCI